MASKVNFAAKKDESGKTKIYSPDENGKMINIATCDEGVDSVFISGPTGLMLSMSGVEYTDEGKSFLEKVLGDTQDPDASIKGEKQTALLNGFNNVMANAAAAAPTGKTAIDMTSNVGMYGHGISQLKWPEDIDSFDRHNGLYTAFFISEHQDSSIAANTSNHANMNQRVLNKGSWAVKSSLAGLPAYLSDEGSRENSSGKGLTSGISGVGALTGATLARAATAMTGFGAATKATLGMGVDVLEHWLGGLGSAAGIGAQVMVGTAVAASVYEGELIGKTNRHVQLNSCIVLPTPSINSASSFRWNESEELLATASGLMHLYNNTDISAALKQAKADFKNNADDMLTGLTDMAGNALNGDLAAMVDKGGEQLGKLGQILNKNTNIKELLNSVGLTAANAATGGLAGKLAGRVNNPRKEQLFDETEFRSFDFRYTMFARSQKEMQQIHSIIKVFRYHAHPELSQSTLMYTYPAQFDIVHYFNGGVNPYMPRHASCILNSVEVEYGEGDNLTVMNDGAPVTVTLTLKFTEIAILDRHDVLIGY